MKINFASTRLAFFLIAILLLFIILSAIIPQTNISQSQITDWKETLGDFYIVIEKLALDRIYFAPYFFIVLGLLAINLIVGNVKRFLTILKLEKTLLKTRHIGSIIFHLSLVLIMIGIILNYLYKFEGVYGLTEGQSAVDSEQGYFRIFAGLLYTPKPERFQITLNKVDLKYNVNGTLTDAAEISILPSGYNTLKTSTIYLNKPMGWNELEFHYGSKNGYSPEILLTDTSGHQVFKSFVRLATRNLNGKSVYADILPVPEHNLHIEIEAVPFEQLPDSICFNISVVKGKEQIYIDTLMLGQSVQFDHYRLEVPRVRRWCYVNVVESPFLGLVFFGFWSALGGMLIGFLPRIWGMAE